MPLPPYNPLSLGKTGLLSKYVGPGLLSWEKANCLLSISLCLMVVIAVREELRSGSVTGRGGRHYTFSHLQAWEVVTVIIPILQTGILRLSDVNMRKVIYITGE